MQPQLAKAPSTNELKRGDPQAIDEVSEPGPKVADEALEGDLQVTAEQEPGEPQATAESLLQRSSMGSSGKSLRGSIPVQEPRWVALQELPAQDPKGALQEPPVQEPQMALQEPRHRSHRGWSRGWCPGTAGNNWDYKGGMAHRKIVQTGHDKNESMGVSNVQKTWMSCYFLHGFQDLLVLICCCRKCSGLSSYCESFLCLHFT